MAYKVTALLVVVTDKTGQSHHVYQGGLLPENADPDHVKQLVHDEMVEKVADAEEKPEQPKR